MFATATDWPALPTIRLAYHCGEIASTQPRPAHSRKRSQYQILIRGPKSCSAEDRNPCGVSQVGPCKGATGARVHRRRGGRQVPQCGPCTGPAQRARATRTCLQHAQQNGASTQPCAVRPAAQLGAPARLARSRTATALGHAQLAASSAAANCQRKKRMPQTHEQF